MRKRNRRVLESGQDEGSVAPVEISNHEGVQGCANLGKVIALSLLSCRQLRKVLQQAQVENQSLLQEARSLVDEMRSLQRELYASQECMIDRDIAPASSSSVSRPM
uniref:Uncharacterized protein n=1 Tax=Compsopogon caeruleus TaxID=31354 RepID=A0A6T6AXI6_9RHOD|mmetsp:Transcript_11692/g.23807  ORF Transcript_11692/g.23807 Transcript_11692/m.23807 type:complete len:106 (+) Transcript_11692:98-415(+)